MNVHQDGEDERVSGSQGERRVASFSGSRSEMNSEPWGGGVQQNSPPVDQNSPPAEQTFSKTSLVSTC